MEGAIKYSFLSYLESLICKVHLHKDLKFGDTIMLFWQTVKRHAGSTLLFMPSYKSLSSHAVCNNHTDIKHPNDSTTQKTSTSNSSPDFPFYAVKNIARESCSTSFECFE